MPSTEVDMDVLRDLDEQAEEIEASESGGGGKDIPNDGEFQVQIEEPSTGFYNTDSDGVGRARVIMRVVNHPDPEIEGATDTNSWWLVNDDDSLNERGVSYLKSDLATMGIEFTRLSEVDELLSQCVGAVVGINRKENKNGYPNTYINDLVQQSDAYDDATGY